MQTPKRRRFKTLVRIDPYQLRWLKENKDTKTIAGYLDKIINFHKLYGKDILRRVHNPEQSL
jgi:hypothetical protein